MTELGFRVLGPVEITTGTGVVQVGSRGARTLLAVLLLEVNQVVPVAHIEDVLWEHNPPSSGRTIMQSYVSRLRKLFAEIAPNGEVEIVTRPPGYLLRADPELIDVHRVQSMVAGVGELDAQRRARVLGEALSLWRGQALADLPSERLRTGVAADLEEFRLGLLEDRIDADLELGRHAELLSELSGLLARQPFRERMIGQLMIAMHRCGQRAEAIGTYLRYRRLLADELGVDPGTKLRDLYASLLRDDQEVQARNAQPSARATTTVLRPAQLPPEPAGFAARESELSWMDSLLTGAGSAPRVALVVGNGGMGKSALTVSWARRVADRFPDGQLYASLRGFDPERSPVEPAEVLRQFLVALGIAPAGVPVDFDERVALYRSMLAGRRVLVLLDDARDAEQVRDLLPVASGSLALVASRRRLGGLAVSAAARVLTLDALPTNDAVRILAGALGEDRVEDPDDLRRLAELCGGLPLALRIVAARLAVNPNRSVATVVAELADEQQRLGALGTEDDDISVRGAFDLTFHSLDEPYARFFRLLGVPPGPDVTPHLASVLAGVDIACARRSLRALAAAHLVTEHRADRFTMHDLTRLYARSIARELPPTARVEVENRLVDYYLTGLDHTRRALRPTFTGPHYAAERPELVPAEVVDRRTAMGWLDDEWPNLVALLRFTHTTGRFEATWTATHMLSAYLFARCPWEEWFEFTELGVDAARRLGDRFAEVRMLNTAGLAYRNSEQNELSMSYYMRGYRLAEEIGDSHHVALIATNMVPGLFERGETEEAERYCRLSVQLSRRTDDMFVLPLALTNLGEICKRKGEHQQALEHFQEVLALHQRMENFDRIGMAWLNLGQVSEAMGELEAAERYLRDAARDTAAADSVLLEAWSCQSLGRVLRLRGELDEAATVLTRALELFGRLGLSSADDVRAELEKLSAERAV
ncbi:AfsR/SARP family transcriptional regulator [Allokutzneria albata]|uniref:DNA-binding transcriptional activator of the SARP family n=1 Tax=Allokutzneria albata TaxID=211114 RepID=A0A1H0ASA2_ALLAB|nr:BTAD domain-containing putative transcriptional regulator [Allokutzneria albata]SDN35963.1 DNA-binding transcriptional activator of the SARP family [Allokutzneria albata]